MEEMTKEEVVRIIKESIKGLRDLYEEAKDWPEDIFEAEESVKKTHYYSGMFENRMEHLSLIEQSDPEETVYLKDLVTFNIVCAPREQFNAAVEKDIEKFNVMNMLERLSEEDEGSGAEDASEMETQQYLADDLPDYIIEKIKGLSSEVIRETTREEFLEQLYIDLHEIRKSYEKVKDWPEDDCKALESAKRAHFYSAVFLSKAGYLHNFMQTKEAGTVYFEDKLNNAQGYCRSREDYDKDRADIIFSCIGYYTTSTGDQSYLERINNILSEPQPFIGRKSGRPIYIGQG
ncbi:MAG: hypothetical protein U9O53_01010 [archaeon]|nr:hypothetical protein [archaeon]